MTTTTRRLPFWFFRQALRVWCKACRHRAFGDWQRLIDAGKGDVPIVKLKWRCSACGSRLTDAVMSGDHM
jgi:hypothetical protein